MAQTAEDFLMGGGRRSASFAGSAPITVSGVITAEPKTTQQRDITSGEPKFWKDTEDPMMQLEVPLQTDQREDDEDDGIRTLFVFGNKQKALRDAVKAAGAKKLEVGGKVTMTYYADDETKQVGKGMNKPKLYRATYEAPNPLDNPALGGQPNPWSTGAAQPAATPAAASGPAKPANIAQAVWDSLPLESRALLTQSAGSDDPPF